MLLKKALFFPSILIEMLFGKRGRKKVGRGIEGGKDLLVRSITQIVHDDIQGNDPIGLAEEGLIVPRYEGHVVKGVEVLVKECRVGEGLI